MSASGPPRLLAVRVRPNSRQPRIEENPDGSLVAYLKAPPLEGRANQELVERLAAHCGVPQSRLRIRSGLRSRNKLVEILY